MSVSRTWSVALLLLALTCFAGSTFGTLLIVMACFALAAMLVWFRQRDGATKGNAVGSEASTDGHSPLMARRWLIRMGYGGLILVVVGASVWWRVESYSMENASLIVLGADAITHASLFCCLLIWIIRLSRGHVALLPLGMTIVVLSIAGGGVTLNIVSQTTVALAGAAGFLIGSQLVLGIDRLPRAASSRPAVFGDRVNLLLSVLTLSVIFMVTSVLTKATSDVLPAAQEKLANYLTDSLEVDPTTRLISSTRYVDGSRLGSVRAHMIGDPMAPALRGYSDLPPGYLRGNVFDRYRRKNWVNVDAWGERIPRGQTAEFEIKNRTRARVPTQIPTESLRWRFELPQAAEGAENTLELHGVPAKGSITFSPLTAHWVETASKEVEVSAAGILVRGVRVSQPYVLGVTSSLESTSLDPSRRSQLLYVPADVAAVTRPLAASVCGGLNSAREKAAAIEAYFSENFSYSLEPPRAPRRRDPVVHFLETQHPAHCEFFATSAAMLLRSANVPARYVTGYVMTAMNDEEDYWLARNGDAHAWVEAYDASTGIWFPVEATPGRTYTTLAVPDDEELVDDLGDDLTDSVAAGDMTWYEQFWLWFVSFRISDALSVLFWLAQLPLFFGLLAFLVWRRYRSDALSVDPAEIRSRRLLNRVDRKVRGYSLVRRPHETLHQFADRIEGTVASLPDSKTSERLAKAARWYRQFAAARYRGLEPSPMV